MNTLSVDIDLARKYGKQGPRYTSYPTALKFSEEYDAVRLQEALDEGASKPKPLSLYAHLPFCESMCWFCGCTTIISKDHSKLGSYLDYLEQEVDLYRPLIHEDSRVAQMHFGGGTPNYLDPSQIQQIGSALKSRFSFLDNAECSVELDPRRLTAEHVAAFRSIGMNRASFGVQDLNPEVQEAVNRIQPEEICLDAINWIRREGFDSLNIDLIYGLPLQTVDTFQKTIERVLEWNPERFAIFNYAHVPWVKPGQKLIKEEDMPSADMKLEMMKMIIESLTSRGYEYIGMDHFAKSNDELAIAQKNKTLQRNFQGYSLHADTDIYAFGLSSISQSQSHYRQNHKALPAYCKALDEGELPVAKAYLLSDDDKIRRFVIMRLMCDLELNFDNLSQQLGLDFATCFAGELKSFQEEIDDGLVCIDSQKLTVSETGRLVIRNLAMHFDAYIGDGLNRFSKTI